MKPFLADPEHFIRDLDRVHASLSPPFDVGSFLGDLDRVHHQIAADRGLGFAAVDGDLTELASLLGRIRANAIEKLPGGTKWMETLPKNDPLCCPVGLFDTLDWGLRETAHTRALAWFMDPYGNHAFGDTLLRAFLNEAFDLDGDLWLSDVRIASEIPLGDSRDRLDILMSGKWVLSGTKAETWMVVVEAKIDADEGEDQCARYEDQCHDKIAASDRHAFVFLTSDGRAPTTGSKSGGSEWIRVSFIKLLALFRRRLDRCAGKPGVEFLRLYMTGVLKDLYQLNCGKISYRDDIHRISEYLSPATKGGE